jgi:hypothetical protein
MKSARGNLTWFLAALVLVPALVGAQPYPPVHVVLFTHIEDNTPGGTLGTLQNRQNYVLYRGKLIEMANLARSYDVPWSLQPDWKFLRAALLYEDSTLTETTNDKNLFRYLKEDLGVIIDPHSHENGYNYTDVAHLQDSLGVGGSTVIGGHIWDPDDPLFQEWDRFRVPVPGERYPWALWRGDILMGSGTPFHVNDPRVSGVWRPQDRYHYFDHDPDGNIAAIGQYLGTFAGIGELVGLYPAGAVSPQSMLTSTHSVRPAVLIAPGGIASLEDTLVAPIAAMRDQGTVFPTDFTSLITIWQTSFGSRGFLYYAGSTSAVPPTSLSREFIAFGSVSPSLRSGTVIEYAVREPAHIRLSAYDVLGRALGVLVDGNRGQGSYAVTWNTRGLAGGTYFLRLEGRTVDGTCLVRNHKLVMQR